MSFAADVFESRRLDRLHAGIARERAVEVARDGGRLLWMRTYRAVLAIARWTWPPAVMALVGVDAESYVFAFLAIMTVASTGALAKMDLRFRPFEALYMPSRRALLVARWMNRLPWSLWVGACAVGWSYLKLADASAPTPVAAYVAIALAPTLWALFMSFDGDRDPGPNRTVCEFAFTVVWAALLTTGVVFFAAQVGKPDASGGKLFVPLALCALLAPLCIRTVVKSVPDLRRIKRGSVSPLYVATRIVAGLSAIAWFLVLAAWTAASPSRAGRIIEQDGTAVGVAGLVVTLGVGAFYVAEHLRLIRTAEVAPADSREKTDDAPASNADAAVPRRNATPLVAPNAAGERLFRAHWRAYWATDRLLSLVVLLIAPALGALTVTIANPTIAWWFAIALAVLSPCTVDEAERLHLLGVDYREIAAHQLRSFALLVAAPALAAGLLTPFVASALGIASHGPTDAQIAAVGLIAAVATLRIGFAGLRRLLRRLGGHELFLGLLWVLAIIVALGLSDPDGGGAAATLWRLAIVLAAPGLIGLPFGWPFVSEATLRDERRRAAEEPKSAAETA